MNEMWRVYLLTLAFCQYLVHCKRSSGLLASPSNWAYLDRFCFVSRIGKVRFKFAYPEQYAVQNLYLYYDTPDQWDAAYGNLSSNCVQKESLLQIDHHQIVNLTILPANLDLGVCVPQHRGEQLWYYCENERTFESSRERWWYLAMGNCKSKIGLYLEYELTMTNGEPEQFWFYHFSADEFYILPTDVVSFLVEMMVLVIATVFAAMLHSRQMFHTTYKLFMFCLLLECTSLAMDGAAYAKYASDGVGYPRVRRLGEVFRAASEIAFQLLLILMAKGWTVVRGRLSQSGQWKIFWYITAYAFVYSFLFVWQIKMFDPAKVLYVWESPPGRCLVALRLVGWVWFSYAVYTTLVGFPEKRNFYYAFSIAMTLWYWMGPITIVLATYVLDNWVREKVVNAINNAIAFYGFSVFLLITRPSAANRNFPYHARTNQVDVLNAEEEDPDAETVLPRNPYEVRYDPDRHDIIFTVGGNTLNGFTVVNNSSSTPAGLTQQQQRRSSSRPYPQQHRNGSPSGEPLQNAGEGLDEVSHEGSDTEQNKPTPLTPTAPPPDYESVSMQNGYTRSANK